MKKIANRSIGIDQGSPVLFSDFKDGGEMWAGVGPREILYPVAFTEQFKTPPSVHVGISMWDMDQNTNIRGDISAENVTETGFDILFKTWGDSRIARIRASWMAIGEAAHADDWDIG